MRQTDPESSSSWQPRLTPESGPLYLAIADALAADLRSGRVLPGERLPTQRALAEALGIDFTTVSRGYAEARRRGLIEATVGRGTFARAATGETAPAATVDMSMNLPPQPAAAHLAEAVRDGVNAITARADFANLMTYRDGIGGGEDRQAGANWLQPHLGALDPARVLVASGAQTALIAILTTLAEKGARVIAPSLTYSGFRAAATHLGLQPIGVALDHEGLLPEALDRAAQETQTRLAYCVPTLHNPTTATMSLARRQQIIAVARARDLILIEDDPYSPLVPDAPPPLVALAPERVLHISSLAKALTPALRIAYLVVPDAAFADRLTRALRAVSLMPAPLMMALATHWIRSGNATRILDALRKEAMARQRLAARHLPADLMRTAPEAYHIWLTLPGAWPRARFVDEMQRQGLALVPSDAFTISGDPPEAVRVCLGAATSQSELDRALALLGRTLLSTPQEFLPTIV